MALSGILIDSLSQVVENTIPFIQDLKRRLTASRALIEAREATILQREATILQREAVIATRDTTIVQRNEENAALLTLVDEQQAEITRLGGDIAIFGERYQELLALKDAALLEREQAEAARAQVEAEKNALLAEKDALLAEKDALLAEEAEEERTDAIKITKLQDAIERMGAEVAAP